MFGVETLFFAQKWFTAAEKVCSCLDSITGLKWKTIQRTLLPGTNFFLVAGFLDIIKPYFF